MELFVRIIDSFSLLAIAANLSVLDSCGCTGNDSVLPHDSLLAVKRKNPVQHLRWSFNEKVVAVFNRYLFLQKSSIVDVRLDSKYASVYSLARTS